MHELGVLPGLGVGGLSWPARPDVAMHGTKKKAARR